MADSRQHWDAAYKSRPRERLGWHTPTLRTSLEWITALGLPPDAPIIDVGGGASTLVDDLIGAGYQSITVLDISAVALGLARRRLGNKAERVAWLNADITEIELPRHAYGLWHDRAVFHFLDEARDRELYRENLLRSVRPGGHVIIATFAPQAPPRCSGLPVQRYDRAQLMETLGPELELIEDRNELHVTPGGVEQPYLYCRFRLRQ